MYFTRFYSLKNRVKRRRHVSHTLMSPFVFYRGSIQETLLRISIYK